MSVDCHMHMVLDGQWWRTAMERHTPAPDEAWIRQQLTRYRDQGFTYLRDGGDRLGASRCAREMAPEYGIVYRTPLAPIHRRGHYGSFIGTAYEDLQEFRLLVRQHRADGADFIKIMLSGLMEFDSFGKLTEEPLPEEEIHQLIAIAHDAGMAVMVHSNGARTVTAAAAAGVDSVEHGAYLDAEALEAMAGNGVVWVPTMSTVANPIGKGRFRDESLQLILESTRENVRRFAAMGGLLAPGTDAGAWAVPHGSMTEYALFAEIGISPAQLEPGIQVLREKF